MNRNYHNDDAYMIAYADSNIQYGGLFVKLEDDYAMIVEVTDLDSATGANNLVLIESGSVSVSNGWTAHFDRPKSLRDVWRDLMSSYGPLDSQGFKVTGIDRLTLRRMLYVASWQYGLEKGIDTSIVLATSNRCKHCGDPIEPTNDRFPILRKPHGWTHSELTEDDVTYPTQIECDYMDERGFPRLDVNAGDVATPDFGDPDGGTWLNLMPEEGGIVDGDNGIWEYLESHFDITRPKETR